MAEIKKIVVIDDEKDLCFLIKSILEATGLYTVLTANDGAAGKNLCFSEQPDLIFLDFIMPKEKGDKVVLFLKSHDGTKKIPVILMSGLGEMVYLQKSDHWKWLPNSSVVTNRGEIPKALKWEKIPENIAKELGVAAFLPKPFSNESLVGVAAEIIRQYQKIDSEQ